MNETRRFLAAGLLGAALSPAASAASPAAKPDRAPASAGPGLLTVNGQLGRSNRGPLDPALDQLMVKHGLAFEKAFQFDSASLARLPVTTIEPTLEYDAKVHRLGGPLLTAVVEAAGVAPGAAVMLILRAIDGYKVGVSMADARAYRMIIATSIDGAPLSLGGLGPLWAVYDADRLPAFKDKPVKERFGLCPWGLYSIDVKAA